MKITKNLKLMLRAILMKCGELATDKGILIYDGELAVGTEVFVENVAEDGAVEYVPAADGEYVVEDKVYVVAEGKIAEIKDVEAPAEEPAQEQMEEVVEPGAENIDEPEKVEDPEATIEERVAALEAKLAEFIEGIEKILNAIGGIEARVAEVETKIAGLEKPGAEPINETPVEESEQPKSKLSYLRKK